MKPVILLLALIACGPKAAEIESAPKWSTEEGKREIWRDMAGWYIEHNMPAEALDMVARLRDGGETSPELDIIQGRALLAQGVTEEARAVLEAAARKLPKDPRPLRALGVAYADLNEIDEAVTVLQRAIEFDPKHAATRNNLGFLLLGQGDCVGAATELEAVIALDGSMPRYRNNLAFALVCQGEAQRALQLFRTTGSEADARYNMGVAYERLDSMSAAWLQYQKALVSDPTHAAAQEAVARLEPLGLDPDNAPAGDAP